MLNSPQSVSAVSYISSRVGVPMFDPATTALLRAVFDEVCEVEVATNGDTSPERLKQV